MADPFVAEIRIFPFNFAPVGWAFCNGQVMPISQNTALFSLLGTTYGGNGTSNFALPNMQGNAPMSAGQGNNLTPRNLGESGGASTVNLTVNQMPAHSHAINCLDGGRLSGQIGSPTNSILTKNSGTPANVFTTGVLQPNVALPPNMIAPAGGGQPHNNMMPFLTLNFCIALQGVFPPRS
jgi:microcystin-dependent protein